MWRCMLKHAPTSIGSQGPINRQNLMIFFSFFLSFLLSILSNLFTRTSNSPLSPLPFLVFDVNPAGWNSGTVVARSKKKLFFFVFRNHFFPSTQFLIKKNPKTNVKVLDLKKRTLYLFVCFWWIRFGTGCMIVMYVMVRFFFVVGYCRFGFEILVCNVFGWFVACGDLDRVTVW